MTTLVPPGKFLTFTLNGQTFGVSVVCVRAINQVMEVTPIPQTPKFVAGVIKFSDHIIPLVGLREKFGMPPAMTSKESCTIIIDSGDGLMGVIVDGVKSIVDLTSDQIDPTPRLGEQDIESVLLGIGKSGDQVIILVDISKTLSKEHLTQVVQLGHAGGLKSA